MHDSPPGCDDVKSDLHFILDFQCAAFAYILVIRMYRRMSPSDAMSVNAATASTAPPKIFKTRCARARADVSSHANSDRSLNSLLLISFSPSLARSSRPFVLSCADRCFVQRFHYQRLNNIDCRIDRSFNRLAQTHLTLFRTKRCRLATN